MGNGEEKLLMSYSTMPASPAAPYKRLPAVTTALTRLTVPLLVGASSRNRSIGVPGVVKSIARTTRSVLDRKSASFAIGAIDVVENGTLPTLFMAAPLPTKTFVCSSDDTYSFPFCAFTVVAFDGFASDPMRCTTGLMLKTSTDASPSA